VLKLLKPLYCCVRHVDLLLMKKYDFFKTVIDRCLALIMLVVLSPVLLVAVLAIRVESKGPVFFTQIRLGRNCSVFHILKFRTMTIDKDRAETQTFFDSPGITRVGSVLRRWKIDELPQLFNVLRGDMSLVGPRPALPQMLDEIDQLSRQRFSVRPGLTGWAQVNGNIALPWPIRWKYDVEYVKSRSFLLDCRIISRTVLVILFGDDYLQRRNKQ
jgi:undecaprenyl phosphate N,N'-diacetylbacillosamine 1-phosphate transferase